MVVVLLMPVVSVKPFQRNRNITREGEEYWEVFNHI